MGEPFTIRIFVPDGDPEGIKIIDRLNWTGVGLWFPRGMWQKARQRPELLSIGVYILVGYRGEDGDIPVVYVGQADGVRNRIESHLKNKPFWDFGIVFTSPNGTLNRAHVTWLEYELLLKAKSIGRCEIHNEVSPREPPLTESEKADTRSFFKEILRILPLVGIRSFENPKVFRNVGKKASMPTPERRQDRVDTLIVPARPDGFQRTFIEDDCWYAVRISHGMIDKIKYIAAYQTTPRSAITHYASVARIESFGDDGKYKLIFSEPASEFEVPIEKGNSPAIQGPRYAEFEKLVNSKRIDDIR